MKTIREIIYAALQAMAKFVKPAGGGGPGAPPPPKAQDMTGGPGG